jgi:hypothetical protein
MNRRRKKSSENKIVIKNNKIIRCKNKMIPVFESDFCKDFLKKDNTQSNNICKNCKFSF